MEYFFGVLMGLAGGLVLFSTSTQPTPEAAISKTMAVCSNNSGVSEVRWYGKSANVVCVDGAKFEVSYD